MRKIILSRLPVYIGISLFAAILIWSSCTKKVSVNPTISTISPDSGTGNTLVTVTGSGLSSIQAATLDLGNVQISLNSNFNTDGSVLFRIPAGANVGTQHIVFTNAGGYQYSVPFTILPVPVLSSAYPAEWQAGNTVTVTGNYLQNVYHVALSGTSDSATILSASTTQLVLKMPSSAASTAKLVAYNTYGSGTTSFSLINMDQQLIFFTDDYGPGMQDWSWCASSKSTDFAVSGTTSLKETFSAAGSQGLSFHSDDTITIAKYQYISFWVKGGSADNTIKVFTDAVIGGSSASTTISVPSGIWTYITIPMSTFNVTTTCQRFDFQITGPAATQTLYFDNVILVKQ